MGVILGSSWDNGKENGSYYIILGLYMTFMTPFSYLERVPKINPTLPFKRR